MKNSTKTSLYFFYSRLKNRCFECYFEFFFTSLSKNLNIFQKNLIYYIDKIIEYQRFCISLILIKKFLYLIYKNEYSNFQKCYKIVLIF